MTTESLPSVPGPRPLRAVLPGVLVAGLLAAVCASELLWGWRDAQAVANVVVDGQLRHALLAVDASLDSHDNDPSAPEVQRLLGSLRSGAGKGLRVQIVPAEGPTSAVSVGLPRGDASQIPGQMRFQDTHVDSQTWRMGSLVRLPSVSPGSSRPQPQRHLIQVAESASPRDELARHLMVRALLRDLGLALLAGLLAYATLAWGMRPLKRVTDALAGRRQDDLTPLPTHALPGDVHMLVHGVNQHLARMQGLIDTRRRFMDDTAHQLRAPLTILQTQVSCALREPDPTMLRQALDAIQSQLDDAVRQTQQMLTLARTDEADFVLLPTDVHAVAAACARDWWRTARAHGITLNFDAEHAPPMLVSGHAGLIKEALTNLLHNAVRHSSAGGHITVGLQFGGDGQTIRLSVTDDGPGIPAADLPRIGERYYRASNTQGTGSGLGLAIVRTIMARHGGQMQLGIGHQGQGLAVTLVLPTAPPHS